MKKIFTMLLVGAILSFALLPAQQVAATVLPTLIVSDSFISFNYTKGGTVPPNYLAHISNNSSTETITYTISVPNQPAWLNASYTTTPLPLYPLQTGGVGASVDPVNLAVGTYNTTIYFTGNFSNSPASIAVTLTVTSPGDPLQITTTNLPDATVGQTYSTQLAVTGGVAPYKWSPIETNYPSGCCILGISGDGPTFNTQTASTVENHPGNYYWKIKVVDSVGNTATKTIYLTIKPVNANSYAYFQINTIQLPAAKVGTYYNAKIEFQYITSGINYASNATFSGLPPGITTGSSSGPNTTYGILPGLEGSPGKASVNILGTPTTAGNYIVTLSLTDQYSANLSYSYALTVSPQTQTTDQRPDFYVTGGEITPKLASETNAIEVNKAAILKFIIGNKGGSYSAMPVLEWQFPTDVVPASDSGIPENTCKNLTFLAAGQTCIFAVKLTYGQTTTVAKYGSVKLVIDPQYTIYETDKTNNWMTVNFDVKQPGQTTEKALAISTNILPAAIVGQPYSTQLQATGGIAPYKWSPINTNYPSGCCVLGISGDGPTFNTQTASTVENHPGNYFWEIKVTDAVGNTATKTVYLNIYSSTSTPTPTPTPTPVPTPTPTPTGINLPDGTVLKLPGGATVYLVSGGQLKPFTSGEEFLNKGYKWSDIKEVNPNQPTGNSGSNSSSGFYPYPSGSLVNDDGTIYFISGHSKIPFTNWQAFSGLGYLLKNVVEGDLTNYAMSTGYFISTANAAHPWGSWLIYKGTVYYASKSGLIGVPSAEIMTSNGGNWNLLLKANAHDIAVLNSNPNLPALMLNDTRVSSPEK